MKFSIIIPLYNKAGFIQQTLASVLAQPFADLEVIVVDDGSSDGSSDIVATIPDSRLKLVRQDNSGVAVARNRGISLASGEWIGFLDADDWMHPLYLTRIEQAIAANPEADVVASRFRQVDEGWSPKPWRLPEQASLSLIHNLPQRWMEGIPFFTGSIVIRRTLLTPMQPCFPVGESHGEDLDLWFRLAERTHIVLVEQALIAYRTSVNGSLSSCNCGKPAPYLARMRKRAMTRATSDPMRHSMLRFVAHQYITLARLHAAAGRRSLAMRLLIKTFGSGWSIKRWWSTLLMTTAMPGQWIGRWQTWREQRKAI